MRLGSEDHGIRIEEDLSNAGALTSINSVPANSSVLNLEALTAASGGILQGNVEPLARILMSADGDHSFTSRPGRISFQTTSTNGTESVERVRIDKDGNVIIRSMPACTDDIPANSLCFTEISGVRVISQK